PVARHQDHRMLLHLLDHPLEPRDLEPGEHARPDTVEDEFQDAEVEAVEAGGHLLHVAARLLDDLAPWDAALVGEPSREARQLGVAQHDLAHLARRVQRRPVYDALLAQEVDLQHARQPARGPIVGLARRLAEHVAEGDLATADDLRLAAVPDVREESLRLPRRVLDAVEERRHARLAPAIAGAAAHDGERNQVDRTFGMRASAHDLAEEARPEARLGERASAPAEHG